MTQNNHGGDHLSFSPVLWVRSSSQGLLALKDITQRCEHHEGGHVKGVCLPQVVFTVTCVSDTVEANAQF